jgi:hypothetical protein
MMLLGVEDKLERLSIQSRAKGGFYRAIFLCPSNLKSPAAWPYISGEDVNIHREAKQMTRPVLRGDIYRADLSPVVGSEQGGVRPALVIQNDIGNKYSPTVIVAAITSRDKPCLPTHISLTGLQAL